MPGAHGGRGGGSPHLHLQVHEGKGDDSTAPTVPFALTDAAGLAYVPIAGCYYGPDGPTVAPAPVPHPPSHSPSLRRICLGGAQGVHWVAKGLGGGGLVSACLGSCWGIDACARARVPARPCVCVFEP